LLGLFSVELLIPPLVVAVAFIVARAIRPVADLIREERRLRLWRYFHDSAVKRGQDPDPVEMIRAVTEGRPPPERVQTRPALSSPPKSDDKSLAA
jgi:hypothetical protein